MSAPAAIQAQLVDVRNVSSHKCVRLEIHVPAEQAGDVMAAFGWPTMADPVPVALARLISEHVTPDRSDTSSQAGHQRRPFSELPLAQQAALRCQEPDFARFLQERQGPGGVCRYDGGDDWVAGHVRYLCGVTSRGDIGKGPNDRSANDSGFKWRSLDAEYYAWQRGRR